MAINPNFKDHRVEVKKPFRGYQRVSGFSGLEGKRIKNLLPQLIQSSPLILDTNFVQLYNLISVVRNSYEDEKNIQLAEYFLNSGYGQIKTIFGLAQQGRNVISTPGIIEEIRSSNHAVKCMIQDECSEFYQLGYFKNFYTTRDRDKAKLMAKRAHGMIKMGNKIPDFLELNLREYTHNLENSQRELDSKINCIKKSHKRKGKYVKTASLEDIMLTMLGFETPNSIICSNDTDVYFIAKNLAGRERVPPICSSIQRVQVGEGFDDTYGVFRVH